MIFTIINIVIICITIDIIIIIVITIFEFIILFVFILGPHFGVGELRGAESAPERALGLGDKDGVADLDDFAGALGDDLAVGDGVVAGCHVALLVEPLASACGAGFLRDQQLVFPYLLTLIIAFLAGNTMFILRFISFNPKPFPTFLKIVFPSFPTCVSLRKSLCLLD